MSSITMNNYISFYYDIIMSVVSCYEILFIKLCDTLYSH